MTDATAADTVRIGGRALCLFGDSVELMRSLPDSSVDCVLTDPPYSSGTTESGKTAMNKTMTRSTKAGGRDRWFGSDSLSTAGFLHLMRCAALEWQRVLRPGGHALCFIDWRMSSHLSAAIESADLRPVNVLVWDKTYIQMGRHYRHQHEFILHFTKGTGRAPFRRDVGNVLQCKPVRGGAHPTEKPTALLETLLSVVTQPGDVVLDPFAGSHATAAAALNTARRVVTVERDRAHFDTGCERLRKIGANDPGAMDTGAVLLDAVD